MTFETIYNDHWPTVYRLCMGYFNDHEQAMDAAQETFIRVYRKLPEFEGRSKVGTWIYRIATNHCLREMHKQSGKPRVSLPDGMEAPENTGNEEQVDRLYELISTLPEGDRLIISMELEGIKQKEIAEIMGLSSGNIRVRSHRIKKKLKQKLQDHDT